MFSMYYTDVVASNGTVTTKQVKKFLGNLSQISERVVVGSTRSSWSG
jgi:hypothetical protein